MDVLVMAAEKQTFESFFLLLKDNKSVLQFMMAVYVHGYIKPMQKVYLMSSSYCNTDFKFSVEDNLQRSNLQEGNVLSTVSLNGFIGVG